MNKRERVLAAIKKQEVDRIPVSFFGHNHLMERTMEHLAAYTVEKTLIYDWDFIKIQLNPYYYAQAWGCEFAHDLENRIEGASRQISQVVNNAADMAALPAVDPNTNHFFKQHIDLAAKLNRGFKGEVPCSHTIFSPLTVADMLAGNLATQVSSPQLIKRLMSEAPDALHAGLRTITDTLKEYARQVVRAGASGILISTTHWASRDYMTIENYKAFGLAYDLELFQAAKDEGADLNIIHICRDNSFFELCASYPVDILSYESTAGRNPSLSEARKITDKAIWGGVDQRNILQTGPEETIAAQVTAALDELGGRGILIGPGCAVPPLTPPGNMIAARNAAWAWRKK